MVFVEWYLRCLWFVLPLGVIVLWVTGKTLEALRSTWLPLSISIIFSLWEASLEPLKGGLQWCLVQLVKAILRSERTEVINAYKRLFFYGVPSVRN